MIAHALNGLPDRGATGSALRDLASSSIPPERMFFGAVLTDIRDFLKLRFRTNGLPAPLTAETLSAGPWPEEQDLSGVVNFLVTALDALSRLRDLPSDFGLVVRRLRDLSRSAAKATDPRRRVDSLSDTILAKLYDDPWDGSA